MNLLLLTVFVILVPLLVGLVIGRWWWVLAAPAVAFGVGMLFSLSASPATGEMGSLRGWVRLYTLAVTPLVAASALIGTLTSPRRRRSPSVLREPDVDDCPGP